MKIRCQVRVSFVNQVDVEVPSKGANYHNIRKAAIAQAKKENPDDLGNFELEDWEIVDQNDTELTRTA